MPQNICDAFLNDSEDRCFDFRSQARKISGRHGRRNLCDAAALFKSLEVTLQRHLQTRRLIQENPEGGEDGKCSNLLNGMVDHRADFAGLLPRSMHPPGRSHLSAIIFATLNSTALNRRAVRARCGGRSLSCVAISLLESFLNSEFNISSCCDLRCKSAQKLLPSHATIPERQERRCSPRLRAHSL